MPGSMLILTWVGIIFVKILHRATNIMPTHVKISIEPGIRELFLNLIPKPGTGHCFDRQQHQR
jgi:hypothetical protein